MVLQLDVPELVHRPHLPQDPSPVRIVEESASA
jgi:hypothetical protein